MSESVEELNYPIKCVDCGWAGIWANLKFRSLVIPLTKWDINGELSEDGEEHCTEPCCPNCRSIRLE